MTIKRIHAVIEGRVQGVFFRARTAEEAGKLALSGWVRNRPDGSVESEIEGEETELALMMKWLHNGPPMSTVNNVTIKELECKKESGFKVKY